MVYCVYRYMLTEIIYRRPGCILTVLFVKGRVFAHCLHSCRNRAARAAGEAVVREHSPFRYTILKTTRTHFLPLLLAVRTVAHLRGCTVIFRLIACPVSFLRHKRRVIYIKTFSSEKYTLINKKFTSRRYALQLFARRGLYLFLFGCFF